MGEKNESVALMEISKGTAGFASIGGTEITPIIVYSFVIYYNAHTPSIRGQECKQKH